MKPLVIIPTYNEKDNIEPLVRGISAFDIPILFVDDNSPDGTADEIENVITTGARVVLLKRDRKLGLGSAYRDGFGYARKHGYDTILLMDADLSHPLQKIPEMLSPGDDIVCGSRYHPEGSIEGWPIHRRLLSRCANTFCRILLKVPVRDMTSGFTIIRRHVLEKINADALQSEGYGFLIELKYRALQSGCTVREVPITFTERKRGRSKLGNAIIWEAFWLVLRLGLKP